ncbi:MAG TPA: 3-mercaptopyruvate sulfurtransferase [Bauldia sp.]|nr:3-mercaptopyruvate sulfurtransferase [Bauldia sp.]
MSDRSHWFIPTEELASRLGEPNLVVLDGSWHLATTGRNAAAEYAAAHIPGAIFFDIDTIADTSNPLPHMLPDAETFARMVGALGIGNDDRVVVYDTSGLGSAARVWWTFRVMGCGDIRILDGGLPKWRAEGRPVDDRPVRLPAKRFTANLDPEAVADLDAVRRNLDTRGFQLVDARPAPRFTGAAPEPRPWVKSGRVPGSFNVPSGDLIADGRLKDDAALLAAFKAGGVDLSLPIVTSCGSGVNAATLSLALDVLGVNRTGLYDGSWTEWGARDDLPIATGAER